MRRLTSRLRGTSVVRTHRQEQPAWAPRFRFGLRRLDVCLLPVKQRSSSASKPFWSGLSGVLAAATAFITAVGGLVAILIQLGVIGGGDGSPSNGGGPTSNTATKSWVAQANEICARANDSIDALPDPQALGAETLGLEGALKLGDQALGIGRRMLRDLRALEAPEGKEAEVERFLLLGAEGNEASEELLASLRVGDVLGAQEQIDAVSKAGQRFDEAAKNLGATTCAEGASFVGADFASISGP